MEEENKNIEKPIPIKLQNFQKFKKLIDWKYVGILYLLVIGFCITMALIKGDNVITIAIGSFCVLSFFILIVLGNIFCIIIRSNEKNKKQYEN